MLKILFFVLGFLLIYPVRGITSDAGTAMEALSKATVSLKLFGPDVKGVIRPYGGAGVTFSEGSKDQPAFESGIQGLWLFGSRDGYFGFGLDAGYLYGSTGAGSVSLSHEYVKLHVLSELSLIGLLLQIGGGINFSIDRDSSYHFGLSFALGYQIKIVQTESLIIAIPIIARGDVIFAEQTLVPVRVYSGLSFFIAD
ncbi:MAG: hypothetical protein OEZ36_01625 [Spirochaetota bacterium]|nr:hypothetical protein [Spirochaetota bacterium]